MKSKKYHIPDKWAKTMVLQRNGELRAHLPATRRLNQANLLSMLKRYNMVYVKPCFGFEGRGVMRAERSSGNVKKSGKGGRYRFQFQKGRRVRVFSNGQAAYRSIRKEAGGKAYIVQKGIRLLTYEGRPFDIRVMVQKSPKGRWEVTGAAGRVAHPRKIVTNGSQGGTIYPVEVLLKGYASEADRKLLIGRLKRIARLATRQLRGAYPGIRETGVDIAIDRQLRLWILEVNTMPDPCPFTKLKDKRMLRRILHYGRSFGRKYHLRCTRSHMGSASSKAVPAPNEPVPQKSRQAQKRTWR